MDKEQRDRTFNVTPLMDIVNIQDPKPFHFDVTGKHWKFIEFAFMRAPVVAVFPFVDQTFHIGEGDAIVPADVVQFIREAGVGKFAMQEGNSVVRYGNLESAFRGHEARYARRESECAAWFELICVPGGKSIWADDPTATASAPNFGTTRAILVLIRVA
jgi:hypothetical protein